MHFPIYTVRWSGCIAEFKCSRVYTQVDDSWSSIPWISGENLQETPRFRPEPAGECQEFDTRIRWPYPTADLTGSCRFRAKPDKSGHRIRSPEYCFHEISGIPRNRPFPAVRLWPGIYSLAWYYIYFYFYFPLYYQPPLVNFIFALFSMTKITRMLIEMNILLYYIEFLHWKMLIW